MNPQLSPARQRAMPKPVPQPKIRLFDRLASALEWFADTIALTAIVLIMTLTVVNVVGRFVFNQPVPGSLNITLLYLMPALVFLALPRLQADQSHISATLVVDRLSPVAQRVCRLIVLIVIILVLLPLFVGSFEELAHNWSSFVPGQPPLVLWPSWILIPIGLGGALLRAVIQVATGAYKRKTDTVLEGIVDVDDSIYPRDEPATSASATDPTARGHHA